MGKNIKIGNRLVGDGQPAFIVAEVANCHEGSFETAKLMVEKIAKTGVDAVKFQLHIPSAEMIKSHPKFHTQTKRSLSVEHLRKLKKIVEKKGMIFLCSPFSREAVDELDRLGITAFKVGSGETSDPSFIEHVAKKGKPMIVSTGMTSVSEIRQIVSVIKKRRTPFMLLHAVSIYPTPYDKLNLKRIQVLREKFKVPVGLSDHVPEIYSAIAAMSYRPALIEKHFTLDKNQEGTSDHKVSLEPHEFEELVSVVHKTESSFGGPTEILPEERPVISWARHAVVSLCDIKKGQKISRRMITTKRPLYDGIEAKAIDSVVGKVAKRDIEADSIIRWSDLAK